MKRIIGIVSAKGGVGKTVTAINLGLALHQMGEEVIILDGDVTASNLGLQLGFYGLPTKLQDVLNKKLNPYKSIYTHSTGLKIIPSSINLDSIHTDVSNLKNVLKQLNGIILVDSPPGLSKDSLSILRACNEVIVVTNPEIPTMTNAVKVIRISKEMKKKVLGIVVNRTTNSQYELTPSEIEIMCEVPILSKIPEEKDMKKSLFNKIPLVHYNPYSSTTIEYKKLAAKLMKKEYQPPKNLLLKRVTNKIRTLRRSK